MFMKLLKGMGYLVYTVIVVFALLWYKFPADAFKIRIEKDLNTMTPALQWAVEEVALIPSFRIRLRNITMRAKKGKETLLTVNSATLRPDFTTWNGPWDNPRNITAKYTVRLLGGTATGHLGLTKDQSTLEYDGVMESLGINKKSLPFLEQEYRRTVQGTLSGNFSGIRKLKKKDHTLQGQFTFAKGEIGLQQPVLGMEKLNFDSIATDLNFDTGTVSFRQGKVTAPLFAADFKGDLHLTVPCSLSPIQLAGSFQPGPEFTTSLNSPSLAALLQKQIQKGPLTFTVNGPLKEPGIFFTNLPPVFNRQMGLIRQQQRRQLPQGSPAK